jgi:linoleoyl-CoA desaturase
VTVKPIFANSESDLFTQTLNERANRYFERKNFNKHADTYMVVKTLFYLSTWVLLYLALIFLRLDVTIRFLVAGFLGFTVAQIGFNVGHDAIHRAYSSRPWINSLLGHSFTLMGANVFVWRTLHNIIHHSYTNIHGADGDLHPVPALRFSKDAPYSPIHRFQYLYAPLLYSLISLVWVFKKDFDYFKKPNHLIYKKPPTTKWVFIELYLAKALYYCALIFAPILLSSTPFYISILAFIVMHLVTGLCLTGVFQLGHIVEGTSFLELNRDNQVKDSWAIHQIKTSANFATKNPLALWLSGGLNFQIEHHLFPRICHTHYPELAKIVKRTSLEFGIPYKEFPTYLSALKSHFRVLKKLGQNPSQKFNDQTRILRSQTASQNPSIEPRI